MQNFTYVISDEENYNAIVVDPSWDLEIIMSYLKKHHLNNSITIINTHSHFDHVVGNEPLSKETGARIMQHINSPLHKDAELNDGDIVSFGKSTIKIIHTPGHSKDSICLIIDNEILITGDTIFVGSCGRLDLPGGSAEEMYDSIYNKLINMDGNLEIFPGHHYGSSRTSTIQKERESNFVFKFKNKDEFVTFMTR